MIEHVIFLNIVSVIYRHMSLIVDSLINGETKGGRGSVMKIKGKGDAGLKVRES